MVPAAPQHSAEPANVARHCHAARDDADLATPHWVQQMATQRSDVTVSVIIASVSTAAHMKGHMLSKSAM